MKISNKAQQASVNEHHLKVSALGNIVVDSQDDSQSPPMSPLRLPQLSSSNSSISSWGSSASQTSSTDNDMMSSDLSGSSMCNSKEDRSTYNTKFARFHLETYRQNDRMRWNFDFDHNRPLDDTVTHHHHHHQHHPHQSVARYQWEPAI